MYIEIETAVTKTTFLVISISLEIDEVYLKGVCPDNKLTLGFSSEEAANEAYLKLQGLLISGKDSIFTKKDLLHLI